MSVTGIIHAESGETGTLAQDEGAPEIGNMNGDVDTDPHYGYTCDVLEPFNDPGRRDTVLQYCYDSCVLAEDDQRSVTTSIN